MVEGRWSGGQSRKIVQRLVVEGDLVLQTPAHFGSGDEDGSRIPLLVDPHDGVPLLTGASIAGALRSYLGHFLNSGSAVDDLFGGTRNGVNGEQSRLIVDDAYGQNVARGERNGVKIAPASRTAEDNMLYTFHVWQPGTRFPLRFELQSMENDDTDDLYEHLAVALQGLTNGGISLGARKRRGFGQVTVENWRARTYDLTTAPGLSDWLRSQDAPLDLAQEPPKDVSFKEAWANAQRSVDHRHEFRIVAHFALDSTLLIRTNPGGDEPDMVYLRDANNEPVLSGTSVAGAVRARATRILNTLGFANTERFITGMFGGKVEVRRKKKLVGSRVIVRETRIVGGKTDLVQSRVSIDRFTGGALETALFTQQPVIGSDAKGIKIEIILRRRKAHDPANEQRQFEAEVGLLLLVLKDLWTGDLPLGGESSVGRGRLSGASATLTYQRESCGLRQDGDRLEISGDMQLLNTCVASLHSYREGNHA